MQTDSLTAGGDTHTQGRRTYTSMQTNRYINIKNMSKDSEWQEDVGKWLVSRI